MIDFNMLYIFLLSGFEPIKLAAHYTTSRRLRKILYEFFSELNSKTIFSDVINNSTTKTFTLAERGSYIVNIGILSSGNVIPNSVSSYIVVTGDHSPNEGSIVRLHGDDRVSVSLSGNILTVTTISNMWIMCTVTKL